MLEIFDFFKSIGGLIQSFVQGVVNLGRILNDNLQILTTWMAYVPLTVWYFILYGIMLTIVLVIVGRANK